MGTRVALLVVGLVSGSAFAQVCAAPVDPTPGPVTDVISATRELRRITLVLSGTTPTVAQLQAVLAAPDDAARRTLLNQAIEDGLASPKFYEQMVHFGHDWIQVGAFSTGAQGDGYQGDMSGHLFACPGGTVHAGKLFQVGEYDSDRAQNVCDNKDQQGNSITAEVNTVEPWWAPGTTVTVVGKAGTATASVLQNGVQVDCGRASVGYYDPSIPAGCGCGPNLVWCSPLSGLGSGSNYDLLHAQRRHPYEEPARLFAHLAWHDRPLSDLVTGNYSVGTNWLRALYVRHGRQQGSNALDQNHTWWKPADGAPRDPLHPTPDDPQAWREFVVEDLEPYLLSLSQNRAPTGDLSRTYQFDPTITSGQPAGLPAAGVLTMIGSLSSFPRERVRAARFLETFACMSFSPPSADQMFPPYDHDPSKGGTCLHCHKTLDPAAIFFKRWDFGAEGYYVPWPFIGGVGRWHTTADWLSGNYPNGAGSPGFRWKNAFVPETTLTPVTAAQIAANPEAVLLDTMPSSYTLLNQHGDGTMGPLGFGKILVASGEFDRCTVRRLYAKVVGRQLDPAGEKLFIDKLARQFVAGDRKLRPFFRALLTQPEFRRGL